jgi:UTP--glucose-1-phosphate uridylyltransferase
MGTRFLPVTKAVPKEMLPILDRPCIEYVVAEAVEAGFTDMVFVTARGKGALEEYFDRAPALEASLEAAGKRELLADVRRVAALARVVSVRQQEARGLGHAVLCAEPAVGDEPFAVILPDDIVDAPRPCLGQLLDVWKETGGAVVALKEVPLPDTRRYGICAGPMVRPDLMKVEAMVEKPAPEEAPSRFSIVGRYLLPGRIFEEIRNNAPGALGEIQLTDAIARLPLVHGLQFQGAHFDTGNPVGLLRAAIHYGLKHPTLGEATRAALRDFA